MANASEKSIDKTHLPIETAEARYLIHRDYIAHCLRWDYIVKKFMPRLHTRKNGDTSVLDIGCGKDLPLMKALYSNRVFPKKYVGVDVNKLELPKMFENAKCKENITLMGQTDFAEAKLGEKFDVISCLEVAEHIEPLHLVKLLHAAKCHMHEESVAFFSTPCYSEAKGAAANHVNEMTRQAFGYMLENAGFTILSNWGTFADAKAIEKEMSNSCLEGLEIFNTLKKYHGSEMFANLFAPAFPAAARNNFWLICLRNENETRPREFPDPGPKPWGSSVHQDDITKTYTGE